VFVVLIFCVSIEPNEKKRQQYGFFGIDGYENTFFQFLIPIVPDLIFALIA